MTALRQTFADPDEWAGDGEPLPASWQGRVVHKMCEIRAGQDGISFDRAWQKATKLYPPRPSDDGRYAPRLFSGGEETVAGAFRRFCKQAWYGEVGAPGSGLGPALVHFNTEMMGTLADRDDSRPAARVSRPFR